MKIELSSKTLCRMRARQFPCLVRALDFPADTGTPCAVSSLWFQGQDIIRVWLILEEGGEHTSELVPRPPTWRSSSLLHLPVTMSSKIFNDFPLTSI